MKWTNNHLESEYREWEGKIQKGDEETDDDLISDNLGQNLSLGTLNMLCLLYTNYK